MSLFKQIVSCLMIATSVAVACYFLPVINGLFGDYLFGFFFAAVVVPIGVKWYEAHMIKVRAMPKHKRKRLEKECEEWHREDMEAMTCEPNNLDSRNVDQQLHIFDQFKD